jgi:hypothetical protein
MHSVAAAPSFSMVMRLFPGRPSFAIICCALIYVCSLAAGCLCCVVQRNWHDACVSAAATRRYFAETSATLFTTILGQRDSRAADGQPFRDYWLSDGTYGSFRIQVGEVGRSASRLFLLHIHFAAAWTLECYTAS